MLNSTRFKSPTTSVATVNVTIPATTAGAKLVVVAGGGAIIQAKLGVGGTNFTRRTNFLDSREVVAQDIVDAGGGTTTISLELNGAENIDGVIYEFAPGALGNYIGGATRSAVGVNSSGHAETGTVVSSTPAVLFAMFTADEASSTPAAAKQFWGFEPLGKQYASEFIFMDITKSKYWSLIGVADLASAGTYFARTSNVNPATTHQSAMWMYEDLQPGTPSFTDPYPNAIAAENSLPGTLQQAWFGVTNDPNIAGYADSMSYDPGDTVNFKVDSFNNAFTVAIYRTGFYNYATFGARLVATVTGTPAVQPAPTVNARGGTECAWSTTASWTIPADAVPGIYIFNMTRGGNRAQGILVVRSPIPGSQSNEIMLTTPDFTWQAYNAWGATTDSGTGITSYTGRNVYSSGPTNPGLSGRAFSVSYDRPMGTVGANGTTYYWDSTMAFVNFMEGNGYPMAYYSMVDLQGDQTIPSKYKVAVVSGHSEYWTGEVRDAFEDAQAAGTNQIFFSGNTALWHTRFDPADTSFRNMICYKDSHDTVGYDGSTKYDPVVYTGTWRDRRTNVSGVNNTDRRPETTMTGQWFIGNGTFEDRIVIPNTYSSLPMWRNTDVAAAPAITVRGTGTQVITSPTTSITISQPSGTVEGDLLVVSITFTGSSDIVYDAPFRLARSTTSTGPGAQTCVLLVGYALTGGSGAHVFSWAGSLNASATLVAYGNAVWEDIDSSILSDTGGTAQHTTRLIANDGATRWAVCVFGDNDTTGSQKTTSWTAGSGLTSRVQADNSASGGGPWCSSAIMDTNGAVTQGTHQYSATAQFANPQGFAGIFYISPGVPLAVKTIGAEWDYLKVEEPTTPTNMIRLSRQAIPVVGGASNYNGSSYGEYGRFYYSFTMFQAPSGALIFNAGAWRYTCGISRFRLNVFDSVGDIDTNMQQALINLVRDMGIAPGALLGTTANVDPTPLVDPGPAATATDYGFPVTAPTTYQTIFGAMPPDSFSNNDNTPYTLGTLFTTGVGGKVYGIRWHFPGRMPDAPVIALLYSWTDDTTGTEITRVNFKNTQTGWNDIMLDTPVTVTPGTRYVAAVYTDSHYVSTSGLFSAAVVNGDLTAPQDTGSAHNGKFVSGQPNPSYPTNSFGASGYLVDVLFTGEGFEGWGIPLS
jgi:hypothetical protein